MKQLVFCALFAVLAFAGCQQTTTPTHEAELMSAEKLAVTPGFDWFTFEKDAYTPDPYITAQIAEAFDSASHRVYLYTNPSCTCKGNQKLFPHAVKVLQAAAIPVSKYELYSMNVKGENHPHIQKFQVSDLPFIAIVKNGVVVGTHNGENLQTGTRVEEFILQQLSK